MNYSEGCHGLHLGQTLDENNWEFMDFKIDVEIDDGGLG